MTDIKLLSLPLTLTGWIEGASMSSSEGKSVKAAIKDYARANVEHHTAAQAAEIEGLKRLVRHLAGNPNFDFEAALAAKQQGGEG